MFPHLKKALWGSKYENNNAVMTVVEDFLERRYKFYRMDIAKLEDQWMKCIARKGDYVEQSK